MRRVLCVVIVLIAFVTWFGVPVLANSGDGVGGRIGGDHSGLSVFSNSCHPDLEKDIDGPGGGIGPG